MDSQLSELTRMLRETQHCGRPLLTKIDFFFNSCKPVMKFHMAFIKSNHWMPVVILYLEASYLKRSSHAKRLQTRR